VLEGLGGKADYQYGNRDGLVTLRELSGFVEDAVSSYALAYNLKQRPYMRIIGESFGDLALSAYSASIDVATRSEAVASTGGGKTGSGSIRVFSNVPGSLLIDGAGNADIVPGKRVEVEDLLCGPHFVEISHALGVFRKDVEVEQDTRKDIINLVVRSDRVTKIIGGTTFVYIPASGTVKAFWMGESEVNFGQFSEFVRQTGYEAQGGWKKYYKDAYSSYPVFHVTWDDCIAYTKWFSKKHGVKATLPDTVRRSHAAGGGTGTPYPWGEEWDADFCHCADTGEKGALPVVGRMGPVQQQFFRMDMTIDGLAHMAGNVREWCSDQRVSSDGSSQLAAAGGGGWRLARPKFFAADYSSYTPVTANEDDLGFRVLIETD